MVVAVAVVVEIIMVVIINAKDVRKGNEGRPFRKK